MMRKMVKYVELFLRDDERLNRLISGKEHGPRHVMWAVLDTLSDWRSTPPFIGVTLDMIWEWGWESLFLRGVAASLLESLSFLLIRNYLPYSDGGVNVQLGHPQMVQAAVQMLRGSYEMRKKQVLIAANIDMALSAGRGMHSDYWVLNSNWGAS